MTTRKQIAEKLKMLGKAAEAPVTKVTDVELAYELQTLSKEWNDEVDRRDSVLPGISFDFSISELVH